MNHYYLKFVRPKFDKNTPLCLRRKRVKCKEIYESTWGPCEFIALGNLKDYEYTDKFKYINVPVLLLSGINDESTPLQNKIMFDNINSPKEWYIFEKSRHMSFYEENDLYIQKLVEFLNKHD